MVEETTACDRRARNNSVNDYPGTNGAHRHSTDHMQLHLGNLAAHDFKSAEENVTSLPVMVLADEKDSGARSFSWNWRSEEHTSELQSHHDLVCRLLLEKKKIK